MRSLVAALCLLSGCAWVFQNHTSSGYSASTSRIPPDCSTSSGWAAVDGVFAVLNAIGVAAAASDDTYPNQGVAVAGGIAWMLVHIASAGTGAGWASDCRKARSDFEQASGERDDPQATAREARAFEQQHRAELAQSRQQNVPAPAAEPRGFFCSSSPTNTAVGFCVRDKAECERTRDISIGTLPDLVQCALVETAWCTGDLCFPSEEACDARRARTGIELACVERE